MKRNHLILAGAFVLVAAVSFGGGLLAHKAASKNNSNNGQGQFGARGGGRFGGGVRNGSRPILGTVSSVSSTEMVVKNSNGSGDTTVTLNGSTQVTDGSGNSAKIDNIQTGNTVAVFGSAGSDGKVAAQRVRINPKMRNSDDSNQPGSNSSGNGST